MAEALAVTLPISVNTAGLQSPDTSNPQNLHQANQTVPPSPSQNANNQKRHNIPWKYEGYQAFTKWMASDDDFFLLRKFEDTNARVLLWMQHQITKKEARLQELHQIIEMSPLDIGLRNDSFEWDAKYLKERDDMTRDLSDLLLKYNQSINAFSQIRTRPSANKRQLTNVRNWLYDNNGDYRDAIDLDETSAYRKSGNAGDIITLSSRVYPPLGQWLESCSIFHVSRLFRAKHVEGKHIKSDFIKYSSNTRFETFTNLSIVCGGLSMLLGPMWWLEFVSDRKKRLAIITVFLVVFILAMMTATVNRPFEVVAATAAYAAVLMVFMQIDEKR